MVSHGVFSLWRTGGQDCKFATNYPLARALPLDPKKARRCFSNEFTGIFTHKPTKTPKFRDSRALEFIFCVNFIAFYGYSFTRRHAQSYTTKKLFSLRNEIKSPRTVGRSIGFSPAFLELSHALKTTALVVCIFTTKSLLIASCLSCGSE